MQTSESLVHQMCAEMEGCRTEAHLQAVYKKWVQQCREHGGDRRELITAAAPYYKQFRHTVEETTGDGMLPTAPVGERVQWFENNRPDRARAAIVIHRVEPGRVDVKVWLPDGTEQTHKGVWHRSHPIHMNPANHQSVHHGSWDYLPNRNVPKADKLWGEHREQLRQQLKQDHLKQLERERQLAEARKAALQAQAADPANARPGEYQEPQDL